MDLSKRAQPMHREVRTWGVSDVELREGDGDTLTFTGNASVVDHPYVLRDMFGEFTETVLPGAFDVTLAAKPDVMFLVNHGGLPLARTASGTLALSANPHLHVEAGLDPSDPDVQRIKPKMKRGDLNEMSFAFRVVRQEWNEDYTDRKILEVSLNKGDVSVVNYGANPATSGSLRALDMELSELDEAFAAIRAKEATDAHWAVIERVERAIADLKPDPQEVPQSIREDLAALYAISL